MKTEALVLASALEALGLQSKEQGEPESEPLELVTRLRYLRFDHSIDLGEGHQDCWHLKFEPNRNHTMQTHVYVKMVCPDKSTCQYGHKWASRQTGVVFLNDTRQGEDTWEYESSVGEALAFVGVDSWSEDYTRL